MTQTILDQLLEDFDYLACPRCGDGGFTDDPDFVEAFKIFASGENLSCVHCGLEYPTWHYGDEYAEDKH